MLQLQYVEENTVSLLLPENLLSIADTFVDAYEYFGMNLARTKILDLPTPGKILETFDIKIHGYSEEQFATFPYL